ncbi:MAG: membrane protein insertion efficiency factor YidD [Bdellovibrionales bacterium]
MSFAAFILRALIRAYQLTFSYFLGRECRFLPTCSSYAQEAIERHGAWAGSGLAWRRFCKCHPFSALGSGHGYDPVPETLAKPSFRAINPRPPLSRE